jgi:hypothetical protein
MLMEGGSYEIRIRARFCTHPQPAVRLLCSNLGTQNIVLLQKKGNGGGKQGRFLGLLAFSEHLNCDGEQNY